jgi:hypothetical protein
VLKYNTVTDSEPIKELETSIQEEVQPEAGDSKPPTDKLEESLIIKLERIVLTEERRGTIFQISSHNQLNAIQPISPVVSQPLVS